MISTCETSLCYSFWNCFWDFYSLQFSWVLLCICSIASSSEILKTIDTSRTCLLLCLITAICWEHHQNIDCFFFFSWRLRPFPAWLFCLIFLFSFSKVNKLVNTGLSPPRRGLLPRGFPVKTFFFFLKGCFILYWGATCFCLSEVEIFDTSAF